MIPLGVGKTLKVSGGERLVLKTSPARRIAALAIFLVLLAAMITALEPASDFSGRRLIGTLFFLLLLAAALCTALYSWQLRCDRPAARITVRRSLLFVTLQCQSHPWQSARAVVLESVLLIRGREQEPPRPGTPPPAPARGWLQARSRRLSSLYLELGERPLLLESSTDRQTLLLYGRRLAEFLQVPFSERERR